MKLLALLTFILLFGYIEYLLLGSLFPGNELKAFVVWTALFLLKGVAGVTGKALFGVKE